MGYYRPEKTKRNVLTECVYFRLSTKEKEQLQTLAEELGISVGEYMRRLIKEKSDV